MVHRFLIPCGTCIMVDNFLGPPEGGPYFPKCSSWPVSCFYMSVSRTRTAAVPKSVQKKWIPAAFCNRGQSRQQLAQLKARNIKTSNPEKNRVQSQSHRVTANRSTKKKVSNPSTPGKKTKNLFSQWYKGFTELWRALSNPLSIAHSSSSWLWTAVSE